MEGVHPPDFGKTADDYATHRRGFPPSVFARLLERGIGVPGSRVVDLGTGTGSLARGFAAAGCAVVAIDVSEAMLAEARRLAAGEGVSVEFRAAPAEATGLPDGSADVVVAGQCWHWFDGPRVAAEARRLLVPGGRVAVPYFDWIPLAGNLAAETECLILDFNTRFGFASGSGIHPEPLRHLAEAGFTSLETFSYDEPVIYTPEGWRGRIRASAGVGASLDPEGVAEFDAALAELLAERFPGPTIVVPHRIFAIVGKAP